MSKVARSISIAIVLILAFTPVQLASAHTKTESCSKVGLFKFKNKKKYICVKRNNSKIWVKAPKKDSKKKKETLLTPEVIYSETPIKTESNTNQTSTPIETESNTNQTSTPIKTDFDISYVTERDLYNKYKKISPTPAYIYEQWKNNLEQEVGIENVNYSISSKFSEGGVLTIKNRITTTINQLNKFATIDRLKVFVEVGFPEDINGICERISLRGLQNNSALCVNNILNELKKDPFVTAGAIGSEGNFQPIIGSNYSDNASVSIFMIVTNEEGLYNWFGYASLEHEYFHIVQRDEVGVNQAEQFPCWLQEGSASYFSILNSTSSNPDAFTQFRSKYFSWTDVGVDGITTTPTIEYLRNWVEHASIKSKSKGQYIDNCASLNDRDKIYGQGALLTEWMISKIGFNNFFILLKEIEVLGFDQAFEKHFSQSLENSYTEMSEYLYLENKIIIENYEWLNGYACYYFLDEVNGLCSNK